VLLVWSRTDRGEGAPARDGRPDVREEPE
jgi:hypothetical protein